MYDRLAWTQAHARWLAVQSFEQPNTELAFIYNLAAGDGLLARRAAIDAYLKANNDNSQPFVWTATTEQILEKVRRGRVTLDGITN